MGVVDLVVVVVRDKWAAVVEVAAAVVVAVGLAVGAVVVGEAVDLAVVDVAGVARVRVKLRCLPNVCCCWKFCWAGKSDFSFLNSEAVSD